MQYISPHLVSGSFFDMAIEVSEENGFHDSSRQLVNACLIPIYGNQNHFEISFPFLAEYYHHALSGRRDIWGPSAEMFNHVLAKMLLEMSASERGRELIAMCRDSVRYKNYIFFPNNFPSYPI